MTAVDIAAICAAITTVFTGFAVGLRFLVKGWLNELRPNSGSSMKDQITDIKGQIISLQKRVDDLFVILTRDN
jgi:tetrahydromethanopterin S-methyltransferase subunit E